MHYAHTFVNMYLCVIVKSPLKSVYSIKRGDFMGVTKILLGARIQELRKHAHLTQAQLAEIIGIDEKHMSKIECGRHFPSLDLLNKIADALGKPLTDFFIDDHLQEREILIERLVQKFKKLPNTRFWTLFRILDEMI